jgi:hypothetical protein
MSLAGEVSAVSAVSAAAAVSVAEVGEGGQSHHESESESERDEGIRNAPATATEEATATATSGIVNDGEQQQPSHSDLFHDAVQTHADETNTTTTTTNSSDKSDGNRPDMPSDSAQWAAIVNIHKELRHSTGSATSASATTNATSTSTGSGSGGPGRMKKVKASNSRRKEPKDAEQVATKGKRGTKAKAKSKATKTKTKTTYKKKIKDPNQPKRPPAAFWLFLKAESASVQSSYPNLSRSEIVSVMSDAWRTASPEDKQPYVEQHEAELTVWREQLQAYADRSKSVPARTHHNDSDSEDDDNNVDVFTNAGSESAVSSATTAAATALLRIAGNKQQQQQQQRQGRRIQDDGCLEPKSQPLQKEDGSFVRPRGAAPGNFSWDATAGLWVPIDANVVSNNNSKPKPTPKSKPTSKSSAATNTQLSKPKAAAATAKTQTQKHRLTDSGCLEAKSKPLQKEDGSFFRPRGATPAGFSWDATAGLWVPIHALASSKPTNSSNTQTKKASSSTDTAVLSQKPAAVTTLQKKTKATAATKTQRLMDGGCMEPKSKPLEKEDGSFVRPRGAAPAGLTWNDTNGLWVPRSLGGDTAATALTRHISNEQSVAAHPASALEGGGGSDVDTTVSDDFSSSLPLQRKLSLADDANKTQAQTSVTMPASKYKFPKVTLTKDKDGSYRRPRGSAPLGHDWDSALGVWVRRDEDTAAQQGSSSNARKDILPIGGLKVHRVKPKTSNKVRAREMAPRSPTKEMRHEPNHILPKGTLQKKGDGTYLRPRGRAPAGCSWDSKRGAWVTINATSTTVSKHPARSSHFSSGEGGVLATDAIASPTGSDSTSQGHPNSPLHDVSRQREGGTSWPSFQIGGLESHRSKPKTSTTVRAREKAPRSPTKRKPKAALQKKGDGTYLRPRGRAPAGYSWEAKRGAWVTIKATSTTASKHPARSSHVSSGEGGVLVLATDAIASPAEGTNSTSQGRLNDPLHALAPEVRLLLSREGVTTAEQFLSRGTSELAKAYIQWRAQENMPKLKGKTSAGNYVSSWKSVVKRASAALGIDIRHPPTKRGRPKGSKRNRAESLDMPHRPLQQSQSREKRRRVERPRSNKPTYVACGACRGCLTTKSCGTCLPCRQRIDTPAGGSEPCCVHCICIAPVIRRTTANKAENAPSQLSMASTNGFRSGDMSSHRSAVRPTDSVVESLSDHDSLVMDDMSDLESPAVATAASLSGRVVRASSGKRSHSKALSGADLARQLQQKDRFRIHFHDSDDDESQAQV